MDGDVDMNGTADNPSGCGTLIGLFFFMAILTASIESCTGGGSGGGSSEIDDILAAKAYVKSQLNYPDTADFHDMSTEVTSTHVKLTVTAKNAFGVPSTHTFNVPRN